MTYSDDVLTMPSKTFSGVGKIGGDAGGKPPSGIPLLACTLYQRLRSWKESVSDNTDRKAIHHDSHGMEHRAAMNAQRDLRQIHITIPWQGLRSEMI